MFQGASFNDRQLRETGWTTPLVGVLCRFRMGKLASFADITEKFVHVKAEDEGKKALSFL